MRRVIPTAPASHVVRCHTRSFALPIDLQPLMRHVCPDEQDTLQQPVLDRSAAAQARNQWGLRQMEENPDGFTQDNAHIRVPLGR